MILSGSSENIFLKMPLKVTLNLKIHHSNSPLSLSLSLSLLPRRVIRRTANHNHNHIRVDTFINFDEFARPKSKIEKVRLMSINIYLLYLSTWAVLCSRLMTHNSSICCGKLWVCRLKLCPRLGNSKARPLFGKRSSCVHRAALSV